MRPSRALRRRRCIHCRGARTRNSAQELVSWAATTTLETAWTCGSAPNCRAVGRHGPAGSTRRTPRKCRQTDSTSSAWSARSQSAILSRRAIGDPARTLARQPPLRADPALGLLSLAWPDRPLVTALGGSSDSPDVARTHYGLNYRLVEPSSGHLLAVRSRGDIIERAPTSVATWRSAPPCPLLGLRQSNPRSSLR